jgi:predicted nucleic acid-binding protein
MAAPRLTLIDTSSWIEALRRAGRAEVRERVANLMREGCAAWCDMVALELWNGARGRHEREQLEKLGRELVLLPTDDQVWSRARRLAERCRSGGVTCPPADLLIAACAAVHGADLEHCDEHFDLIAAEAAKG